MANGTSTSQAKQMHRPIPEAQDVVLVGGGHSHALLLRKWGMTPLPGARLTVINPGPQAPYSGMLPGHVAGHYSRDDLMIDLVRLARFAGARTVRDHATGLDPDQQLVHLAGRPPIAYDIASIDVGIHARMPDLPGFAEFGIAVKPLDHFADRWDAFAGNVGKSRPHITILGGGVAGVELAMAMAFRLGNAALAQITVLEAGPAALPGLGTPARRQMLRRAGDLGVTLRLNARAVEIRCDSVLLDDGSTLPSDFTLGAAGARPHDWIARTPLAQKDGFIRVGPTLQSISHDNVLAVGDCAHLDHAPRPKAGVFAVREAPFLFDNIRALLGVGTLRPFKPQKDFLKLISLGGKRAVADKTGMQMQGRLLWRWKNHIDQTFMDKFRTLPEMPADPLPVELASGVVEAMGDKPLCGGCGAKVGATLLSDTISGLETAGRADVVQSVGDDAAVLTCGDGFQVLSVDHLRAFTLDPYLQARITAVHALGDVWAMGGKPQSLLVNIVLPRLAEDLQRRSLREIMAAISDVALAQGAQIVGGHTNIGDELAIGLTVTGLTSEKPIGKGGAKVGDAILLAKPLGTGVILAAEMAAKARGDWVMGAFDSMARPSGADADVLASVAGAMTDVTGFGLAGHLQEICTASGVGAEVLIDQIPLLHGAEELSVAGHRSSLWPANVAAFQGQRAAENPREALLFDPQTAGGLLATVPLEQVDDVLAALSVHGTDAAVIGTIAPAANGIRLV